MCIWAANTTAGEQKIMESLMLDTPAVARALTEADFTPTQADAITEAVRLAAEHGDHVTQDQFKAGIAEVRTEIAGLDTRLSTQIATLDTRLSTQISEVRTEIATVETRLSTQIAAPRHTTLDTNRCARRTVLDPDRCPRQATLDPDHYR